jgi:hypothetical protein
MKPPLGVLTNKKKQRNLMIAGTKAQTVIAIIEKYRLNYAIHH